jgi:hypothetical protein
MEANKNSGKVCVYTAHDWLGDLANAVPIVDCIRDQVIKRCSYMRFIQSSSLRLLRLRFQGLAISISKIWWYPVQTHDTEYISLRLDVYFCSCPTVMEATRVELQSTVISNQIFALSYLLIVHYSQLVLGMASTARR